MLFNSYTFIFLFLPVSVAVYFLLARLRYTTVAKLWLAASSLFFYSYWNIRYLPLLLASIAFNYAMGRYLAATYANEAAKLETAATSIPSSISPSTRMPLRLSRKAILAASITINLLLLGYYKYADFLITNVNRLLPHDIPLLHVLLPLGISFFTFTQIAFLVDSYKGKAAEYSPINYTLFVTFYPHLIAGPILHHAEMMPQFGRLRNKVFQLNHVMIGTYLFCIGLFKKVVIADTLAVYANDGFTNAVHFIESWITSLSYTLQLYFDFSGYSDMAIGAALFFNIKLPQNFNSPYKSLSIQQFWRRWHMTLSRFLLNYIYIPLGGNRKGNFLMYRNLMLTFLIGGLWHGAGWTFLIWGFMHGAALIVHRIWGKAQITMPKLLAWFLTFMFVNITWVFFRAGSWPQAVRILKGMFGVSGFDVYSVLSHQQAIVMIIIFLAVALFARNSVEIVNRYRPGFKTAVIMSLLLVISLLYFNRISAFLYFNF
ncbi:MBOAT family O-acyltransferase [Paenibacillus sediminis]|uniref:D-alanyl-lipoteichoic acid acyltransferase DltB (MBOAT superfamily) n=1 Tax=Paenibacillus sediminis TaxID=664909 RepID=A0ABS4H2F1_9BACL|nr:MBOAT family O-acyltransferase [Paenibacillus sediminis]MBP1936714.1 D-alanyl-lipoteichoic acid acyltransferase DltB (MBOAT superfamily) [Paenibacillus sediminis]